MGRGRHAGYDDQRELILAQAARLFAERGYPATSMNEVAQACGLSKATLYHYYDDKYALLVSLCDTHVTRLQAIVRETLAQDLAPTRAMHDLIASLVREYASAQHAHRVLTQDVKFLGDDDRERILGKEREVVAGFARVVAMLRPDLSEAAMSKPLTMLLFGMVNWMFTWMRPGGALDYDDMAPVVSHLFLGGLSSLPLPAAEDVAASGTPRSHKESIA